MIMGQLIILYVLLDNHSSRFDRHKTDLTDLTIAFKEGYRFLISNLNKYSEALREASKTFLNKNIGNMV